VTRAGPDPRRSLGAAGELAAARWYEARGWAVLDRNWRAREGELDLVLGRDGTVVFCEVKTRRSHRFGAPVEAVTPRKQQRLRHLAASWLAQRRERGGSAPGDLRFDVASVEPDGHGGFIVEVVEGVG
jgi:putative endonuclease